MCFPTPRVCVTADRSNLSSPYCPDEFFRALCLFIHLSNQLIPGLMTLTWDLISFLKNYI